MDSSLSKFDPRVSADFLLTPKAEDQTFDRKSARIDPMHLAETLVAMANADGGVIAIGVRNRQFEDIDDLGKEKQNELVQASINFTQPMVRVMPEYINVPLANWQMGKILLLHVEQSETVHKTVKDEVFLRIGDESRKLKFEERLQLEYDRGLREYETTPIPHCTVEDLDYELMNQWAQKLRFDGDPLRLLVARGLATGDNESLRLSVAGILLFAKLPTTFLPSARVRFIRYEGVKAETGPRMNVTKEITIEGPLPRMITEAISAIKSQLREFSGLDPATGIFESVPEYPEFAWQEGLVNAIMHRAYNVQGMDIQVRMFDDRLEIESPGRLPGLVRLTNIKDVRFSRNPRIARVLNTFGYVKEFGEGVNRIFEEMRLFHLDDPEYQETNFSVLLILKNNIIIRRLRRIARVGALVSEDNWKALSSDERKALESAYANRRINTKEFAEIIGRSRNYARKILDGLAHQGFLEVVSTSPTDPSRHYRLVINELP